MADSSVPFETQPAPALPQEFPDSAPRQPDMQPEIRSVTNKRYCPPAMQDGSRMAWKPGRAWL